MGNEICEQYVCLSLYSACEYRYFGVGYFACLISLLIELDLCSVRELVDLRTEYALYFP